MHLTFSTLLILASYPATEWLDESRVKVSTVIKNSSSVRDNANAQIKLRRMAKRACRGKGKAVSEGTLHLDNVVPKGKTKEVLVISEVYTCVER